MINRCLPVLEMQSTRLGQINHLSLSVLSARAVLHFVVSRKLNTCHFLPHRGEAKAPPLFLTVLGAFGQLDSSAIDTGPIQGRNGATVPRFAADSQNEPIRKSVVVEPEMH